jgi:PIN domain nuclease of toxin-antitoxin system
MRKYLLDTHTFIWAIVDDDKLPKSVLKLLKDNDSLLFVSAVSFWEMAIKHGKGKLYFENFKIQGIFDYCGTLRITPIPLSPDDALRSAFFPFAKNHKDPFDRMLIYQCIANGYVLVSQDAKMAGYKDNGLECVW